jgi:DNA end-binding protein Ku
MPRPIWKGHISFGLVNIPVTLYSAEHRCDLHFHMLDSRDQGHIRYQRVNEETGEEVPWNEIVKAYKFDDDNYVVLQENELKKAAPEQTKSIDIEQFIDQQEMEFLYFEKPYYLVPDKQASKSYTLLKEALKNTCKIGIAKVVIHSRQHLAAIMPHKNGLMLDVLRFEQEIRPIEEFDIPKAKVQERELELASQLINSMTERWQPKRYHDTYRETIMKWIEEKASGKKAPAHKKTKPKKEAQVVDLVSLMRQSLQKESTRPQSKKPKETA